jgi:hypothetical protein
MPIDISEYATPKFIRMQTRYPFSTNQQDRFNEVNPMMCAKRFMGSVGREGGWKYPGYNPHHQSTRTEVIKVRSDDLTLLPY